MSVQPKLSSRFLVIGVLAAPLGMTLGILMAASGSHQLAPVHAHLLLLGWVGFFLHGLYYRLAGVTQPALAGWHFNFAFVGVLLLVPSLAALLSGYKSAEPVSAFASLLLIVAYLLFAVVVIRDTTRRAG